MKRIAEDRFEQDEDGQPEKQFQLHKYNLSQLQEAYEAYKKVHESIVLASQATKRYNKMMG